MGRDVLLGCTFATGQTLITTPILWYAVKIGAMPPVPFNQIPFQLRGGRYAMGEVFSGVLINAAAALIVVALLLLLRMVLRKTFIAGTVVCLLWGGFYGLQFLGLVGPGAGLGMAMVGFVLGAAQIVVLARFGLLALMSYSTIMGISAASMFESCNPHIVSGISACFRLTCAISRVPQVAKHTTPSGSHVPTEHAVSMSSIAFHRGSHTAKWSAHSEKGQRLAALTLMP